MAEQPERVTATEARAGTGMHKVRAILIISVILAVIAMVWVYAAARQGTQDGATTSADPK